MLCVQILLFVPCSESRQKRHCKNGEERVCVTIGLQNVVQVEVHCVLDNSKTWLKLHQKQKIGHPAFLLVFVWSQMHGDLVGTMTDGWKGNVPWNQLGWHWCHLWVLGWKNHVPPWQESMGDQQFHWVKQSGGRHEGEAWFWPQLPQ